MTIREGLKNKKKIVIMISPFRKSNHQFFLATAGLLGNFFGDVYGLISVNLIIYIWLSTSTFSIGAIGHINIKDFFEPFPFVASA